MCIHLVLGDSSHVWLHSAAADMSTGRHVIGGKNFFMASQETDDLEGWRGGNIFSYA